MVSSPEFAPVPNPSTAHVISSRLASNRTHLKAQVMLSPHGDKARRPRLVPAPPPACAADTAPLADSEARPVEKSRATKRQRACGGGARRPTAQTPRRRPAQARARVRALRRDQGSVGLSRGGAQRRGGTVMWDATRRERRLARPSRSRGGSSKRMRRWERSNAGGVEFMGERERGRQRQKHMRERGIASGRKGGALPLRFDAAARVVSSAWLGRSATHILHEFFGAASARWHGMMAIGVATQLTASI